MRSLLATFLGVLALCGAVRNDREEAICQPFLTSRTTSPLIPNLQRNLTIDEDGEFACELVLQDEQLPVQIRATIHEGLAWLAIRHSQMGVPRERTAAKHYRLLSELVPGSLDFAWKAGTFLMDAAVSDPGLAIKYLHRALYGKASHDRAVTPALTYAIRIAYAKALGQTQQYEAAKAEWELVLRDYPYDFEAAAILSDLVPNTPTTEAYKTVSSLGQSQYHGFSPCAHTSSDLLVTGEGVTLQPWQPLTFSHILSAEEFLPFIQRREPFIIRTGSSRNLSTALGWATQSWKGEAGRLYLQEKAGQDDKVLVEVRHHRSNEAADTSTERAETETFGFGLNARRKVVALAEVLKADFTNGHGNESIYLNIQPANTSQPLEVYRTPLHLLKEDIPLPAMLQAVAANLTEVNLWMGVARDRDSQSRLHMDATDNLYVVLEGRKHFAIASPADALHMHTVSPTYAVSPDGLSFQFNVRKFAAYARRRAQTAAQTAAHNTSETSNASKDGVADLFSTSSLQKHLLTQDVEYDAANYHFSTLDARSDGPEQGGAYFSEQHPTFTHFDLQEGDMLYLPTGWFHQVTSKQGRHMALNYWWRALHWRGAVDFERAQSEALYERLLG
jgi:hypothetical protein